MRRPDRAARRIAAAATVIFTAPALGQDAPAADPLLDVFVESCMPAALLRPSFAEIAGHVAESGWMMVESDDDPELAALMARAEEGLETDSGFMAEAFARDLDGRRLHLVVSVVGSDFGEIGSCYLYDFAADEPIPAETVTALVGSDPFQLVDEPDVVVSGTWAPSATFPGIFELTQTLIPDGSTYQAEARYSGLNLLARWSAGS